MSTETTETITPRVIPRPDHRISRRQISSGALKVLYRLHRAGYLAYLVGGSVRDLLLGRAPKDFDVVTNARPSEIRRLFRNSRVIGRRFRLVHVMFSGEIVEVATFRANPDPPEVPDGWEEGEEEHDELEEGPVQQVDENNLFGTPAEDARRRDFTVNALFYNIDDFSVLDYVDGLSDLDARVLRVIGDPDTRLREDPVRMLRALEYMVRLDFTLAPGLDEAIERNRGEILEAAPARLSYELMETLHSGVSVGICSAWRRFGILDQVFPEAARAGKALGPLLSAVDRRARDRRLPDAVLLGVGFLPAFTRLLRDALADGKKVNNPKLLEAIDNLVNPAVLRLHISHHNLHLIKQGLFSLAKLRKAPERGRQVLRLARHEYFPVAWGFDSLAVEAGLFPAEPHAAWARVLNRLDQEGALDDQQAPKRPRRRGPHRPRRRRRS